MTDRIDEIRNLLERLRIAWERRPEMKLDTMVAQASWNVDCRIGYISYVDDEPLITAIEKLCSEEK